LVFAITAERVSYPVIIPVRLKGRARRLGRLKLPESRRPRVLRLVVGVVPQQRCGEAECSC